MSLQVFLAKLAENWLLGTRLLGEEYDNFWKVY